MNTTLENLINVASQRSSGEQSYKYLQARLGSQCGTWGVGNAKVGGPSTYRLVGRACPVCPYLGNGCYGQNGHVKAVSQNAEFGQAANLAFDCALATAIAHYEGFLRLHTTGDFMRDGRIDRSYMAHIEASMATARELGYSSMVYTYTHIVGKDLAEILEWSERVGVTVLESDAPKVGGVVVIKKGETIEQYRELYPDLDFVDCPAQLAKIRGIKGVTCRRCKACPRARRLGYTIALHWHV